MGVEIELEKGKPNIEDVLDFLREMRKETDKRPGN